MCDMRRLFCKIHLWLSVPFGIIITITCFTGALLVFEDEITDVIGGDIARVAPIGEPLPLNVIADKVDATLPSDVDVKGIVVSKSPVEAYKVNLSKPKKAAVYVNQYTGEVLGKEERMPFFQTVFRLHRWLMDSNPGEGAVFWGKIVVGASTLVFVFVLLTGLVIWWPRNRKMLSNRLCIALKKGKNRFWYDLHVAGGFYAFLLLIVMALTGLNWSFEWYSNGVYSLFGVDDTTKFVATAGNAAVDSKKQPVEPAICPGSCSKCTLPVCVYSSGNDSTATEMIESVTTAKWNVDAVTAATNVADGRYVDSESSVPVVGIDEMAAVMQTDAQSGATIITDGKSGATTLTAKSQTTEFDSWQKAYDNVVALIPYFETITVSKGTVSVKKSKYGNMRAADKYLFYESSGVIDKVEPYNETDRESRISGWFYTLHVGFWCGWFSKICSFIAALLGATLPLTGYYLWIRRLYVKRKGRK